MTRLRIAVLAALIVGLCAPIAASPVSASAATAKSAGDCSLNIQNPHYSDGAGGVISKGTWKCAVVPTDIHFSGGLNLWLCIDGKPEKSEYYLAIDPNCSIQGQYMTNFKITKANKPYVKYVPPGKGTGAQGYGWWIACAVWYSKHDGTKGKTVTSFSNVWYGGT